MRRSGDKSRAGRAVAILALAAIGRSLGDGLPNEYALTQRWREMFFINSPVGNPAWLTEASHIALRGAFAPVLQGAFHLWELGVTVPLGLYHTAGVTWLGENGGAVKVPTWDHVTGQIVTTGETASNTKSLFIVSYALNPWHRLSAGGNLSIAYETNFGQPVSGLGLDLGLTWRIIRHPLIGSHLIGLSTQNLLTPAMGSSPLPAFSTEGAYARGLKCSWYGRLWEGRVESALDIDLRDFWAHADEFVSGRKTPEWGVSWRLGGWLLRVMKFYAQAGFDAEGLEYWGVTAGVDVPTVNQGRRLSMLYQYHAKTEASEAVTHTFYALTEVGKHREEMYARRLARLLNLSPNSLYNRALGLFYGEKYWDAFFVFGQLQTLYPDFFKMDWVSYYMAACQEFMDMRESAARRYREVARKYPSSLAIYHAALGLMRILYREGDFDGVHDQYDRLSVEGVPDSLKHHAEYLMGVALLAQGRPGEALRPLLAVPAGHPEYLFARHSAALAMLRLGRDREALRCLDDIATARPRTEAEKELVHRTFALLGYYFYEEGMLSKAVTAFRLVPQNSYYYEDALLGLAWSALRAQQWGDCVEMGRRLRQTSKHNELKIEGVIVEAYGYIRQNRFLDAAAVMASAYNMAYALNEPSADSLRVRREAYLRDRVVYDSLAEETNRSVILEPVPSVQTEREKMRGRHVALKKLLDDYAVFHDEFMRRRYFARKVEEIKEDFEYLYAFIRKHLGEQKLVEQGLEMLRRQQNIEADLSRLRKELEALEKEGRQSDRSTEKQGKPLAPEPQSR